MWNYIFSFLILTSLGVRSDVPFAGLGVLQKYYAAQDKPTPEVTIQDVKDYIQPIIYQKFLRDRGDSAVVQEAKTIVSEYLVDTLLESVQNPQDGEATRSQEFARQASNGTTSSGSRPSLINVISGSVNITRPRPSQQHVLGQVDRILDSVNGGNITGIVDQALRIRARPGVQMLVNGILNAVLCNPINRLWNRCPGGGGLLDAIGG